MSKDKQDKTVKPMSKKDLRAKLGDISIDIRFIKQEQVRLEKEYAEVYQSIQATKTKPEKPADEPS